MRNGMHIFHVNHTAFSCASLSYLLCIVVLRAAPSFSREAIMLRCFVTMVPSAKSMRRHEHGPESVALAGAAFKVHIAGWCMLLGLPEQ